MDKREKIVPEDYLDLKKVEDIQVNNNFVAWVEKSPDPVERGYTSFIKLYQKDTGELRQFSTGLKEDKFPRFSPDNKKLAFISNRSGKSQIFVMELDGGESLKLTNSNNGVSTFSWSPDSTKLVFTSSIDPNKTEKDKEPPKTKYEAERRKAEEEEEERKLTDPRVIDTLTYRRMQKYDHPRRFSHLFVMDVEDGEAQRISDGEYDHTEARFISDNEVVSISKREKPRDLSYKAFLVKFDISKQSEGEVITTYNNGFIGTPPEIYQGDIFVTLFGEDNFAGQITRWGKVEEDGSITVINEELDRSINQIKIINSDKLLTSVNDQGKVDIRKYNSENKDFTKLVESDASVINFGSIDESEIFFIGTHPKHVWSVWKWTGKNGVELIDDPNTDLFGDKSIITPEEFWIENPEGVNYQGWFFDAGDQDGNKPPLVLSIHGGPHVMWNNAGTMWHEWQSFLSEGYSILAVNPIGSDGYGEKISQIITSKWGIDDARDLLATVDKFMDRVNEDRLYITGGSYAGFQTANIISRDHRFKAACAQRGVYDLLTFGLNTDIPLFAKWEYEGLIWEQFEKLWKHSPVGRADKIETPLLIIHSENDFRVAISQAEELFGALKVQDKEAVLVKYPRDGHELSRSGEPLHVVDRLERMINWFEGHQ